MDKSESIFIKFPILETERLILNELEINDYPDIYEIYSDIEVLKYNGVSELTSMLEAADYTTKVIDGYKAGYFFRWAIKLKDEDKMIGTIGLHHIESWNCKLELGYVLNKSYWRQGYCFESLVRIIKFVFEELESHRIEASIHPDNIPSIELVKKLGFVYEGRKRQSAYNYKTDLFEDRVFYSLLVTDELLEK